MRWKIGPCLRIIWRNVVLPIVLLLPRHRQFQLRTLAHHARMTLWHGQVINFDTTVHQDQNPKMTQDISLSLQESSKTIVPSWAIDELKELAKIEAQLYPTAEFIAQFYHWAIADDCDSGDVYANCIARLEDYSPNIIIIVPWIVPGGADRGVLHHAAAAISRDKKVQVISTMNAESPWATKLPKSAKYLELGRLGSHLSEDQRIAVLTRIVLQSTAKVIHVVNSQHGWEMIRRYGKCLNAVDKKIFASVFSEEIDRESIRRGYPQLYFEGCWKYLHKLISDTHWFPQELNQRYGVSLDKFNTVYFPVRVDMPPIYKAKGNKNILWAGRFAKGKRLDLLIEIAKLLPNVNFDVHGYSINEDERAMEEKLRSLSNVQVNGVYHSVDALIDAKEYSLFLYTSLFDGLPNILLEVTKAGLPVVASLVGGVTEFINEETGYPVEDINNPDAYVLRIREAIGDDHAKNQKFKAAVEQLLSRHTTKHFLEQLDLVEGYFD